MGKIFFGLFLVLLALCGIVWAQEPGSLNLLDAISKPGDKIDIVLAVLDKEGNPIKGLSQANFSLTVEGQEIKDFSIEPITSSKSPMSVVLAIDVSGSMKGTPIIEAKKAANTFLDQLEKEDYVALMVFGSSVRLVTSFTKKHEVREHLNQLNATEQWTWLYQATYDALEQSAKAPTSRAVVILLTDGKDEGSPRTETDVLGRIKGTQIPIYTVGFGAQAQVDYLKRVAGASGGYFQFTPTAEELSTLYNQVMDQLKNQYLLRFPFDRPAGSYHSTVTLNYRGQDISAKRRFLHVRAEPLAPEPPPPPQPPQPTSTPPLPPQESILPWVILALVGVVLVAALVWIIVRRRPPTPPQEKSETSLVSFMIRGKSHPLNPMGGMGAVNKDTQALTAPGEVGLRIDVPPLPLFFALIDFKNNRDYPEIIITRYDEEIKEHYSHARLYLLLSDKTISRPDGQRTGHAVIFFDPDTQRYQLQDLGSFSGTRLNEVTIAEKAPLKNGDTIMIGAVVIHFYDKRVFTETVT
ncbi:MAG: VWA domain-containing protein [Deltaproteobacteria bacterium]|nr:VWA domain-containing protein [Deltaproteobacteria bacterium]